MHSKIHNPGMINVDQIIDGEVPTHHHIMCTDYVDTISGKKFPKQDEEKIGKEYNLLYRDQRYSVRNTAFFRVVRWDLEKPNVVILINVEKGIVIVSSPEFVEEDNSNIYDWNNRLISNEYVHQIPIQHEMILGISCVLEYFDHDQPIDGIILRADIANGINLAVIYETDKKRYVLVDEVRVLLRITDLYSNTKPIRRVMEDLKL